MKKMLLMIAALAAASFLGGCVVEHEHHYGRHPHGFYGPPRGVVVVPVPVPAPHHYGPPHRW